MHSITLARSNFNNPLKTRLHHVNNAVSSLEELQ